MNHLTPVQREYINTIKEYVNTKNRYPSDTELCGFSNLRQTYKIHSNSISPDSKIIIDELDTELPELKNYIDLIDYYNANKIHDRDRSIETIRNFNNPKKRKSISEEPQTDYFMIGIEKGIIKDLDKFKEYNINISNKYLKKVFELKLEQYVKDGVTDMPTAAFHEYLKLMNASDDTKEPQDYLLAGFKLQIFDNQTIKAYKDINADLPEIYTKAMYKAVLTKFCETDKSILKDAYLYFHGYPKK